MRSVTSTRAGAAIIVFTTAVSLIAAGCARGAKSHIPSPSGASLLPASPTALPEFDLATFRALLAELAGKGTPAVVNVWASWCGPCTQEAPGLASVSAKYSGRVQFLGVDIQDQVAPAKEFIERYGWSYPSVFDPTGAIRDGLGMVGQPVTLVFDQKGEQAFVWSGAIPEDVLATELATLFPSA
jgi:thiol-disulfide isomerase/thioredoxin